MCVSICTDNTNEMYCIYIYLCPLISDWSLIPPSDSLQNFLPIVWAIDLPILVLPTPGGPTRHNIGPDEERERDQGC